MIDCPFDSSVALASLHHGAHILRMSTPKEIVATWSALYEENPVAVAVKERIGREHREHAVTITNAILDLLTASAMQEAA